MLKLTLKRGDAVHRYLPMVPMALLKHGVAANLGYTCQKTLRSRGRNRHSPPELITPNQK